MTETFDVNATLGADELVRLTALQMAERLRDRFELVFCDIVPGERREETPLAGIAISAAANTVLPKPVGAKHRTDELDRRATRVFARSCS